MNMMACNGLHIHIPQKRSSHSINPKSTQNCSQKQKVMFAKDMLAFIVLRTFCQHNKCDRDRTTSTRTLTTPPPTPPVHRQKHNLH